LDPAARPELQEKLLEIKSLIEGIVEQNREKVDSY